jgi:hypothetical protein
MNESESSVQATLRIPGNWSNPGELIDRMPSGFRLTPEALILPDKTEIECAPIPPDSQFADIFKSSCRSPATREEVAIVDGYTVNIVLTGPGGSMPAALKIMQAGAAIVRAGGAGVFIDNCALAHGGRDWVEMADDGGPDALSFAFAAIVRGKHEVYTMGMHVLGLPDVLMQHADLDSEGSEIVDVIRYLSHSEKPVGDGHVLADEHRPRFRAVATDSHGMEPGSPMHNPFGRLKLVSMADIAEGN